MVCDCYVLSSLIYQSLHSDPTFIAQLVSGVTEPDLTIVVDAPTTLRMDRLRRSGKALDRFEKDAGALQSVVRQRYLDLAKARGYLVFDGSYNLVHDAFELVLEKLGVKEKK